MTLQREEAAQWQLPVLAHLGPFGGISVGDEGVVSHVVAIWTEVICLRCLLM